MLIRLCPRCNKKINYNQKYCDRCQAKAHKQKQDGNRQYDKHIRRSEANKKYDDFYHSKEWSNTKKLVWTRCNGLDLYDYYISKRITYGEICHHIEPLKENWDRRLDIHNLIYLSKENHNIIESIYERSQQDKESMQELLFSFIKTANAGNKILV